MVALFIVVLTAVLSAVLLLFAGGGTTVTVKQNNKTVYSGDLSDDTTVELEGNTVVIKDKTAYVKKADCKNQICVHTGKISKTGESIVCLPNKVTVEIE